ncbi:hypothetical protein SEA_ALOEVERA_28 [Microbacterium phage AloeVera]|uniref:Uncharacterized protein n=2 Tax=Akonivirus akoni TaxID=2845587 RepID=A0A6M3SZK5_9CAUD|nr:hypothetical protein HWC17_gp27 [Microbacterium phage Akoni]QCG78313.1 hypothetical protein SEA_AKONI_27 [Microbacterium phage Akoni]QJD51277.1 hypothetical protein SEA_TRUONG_27 [Microbacterium phage Truong]
MGDAARKHDSRRRKIDETLKTADNHRQLYTSSHDEMIINRKLSNGREVDDMELATLLGRTVVAISQRRVVLKRLMAGGMTLLEIHETERWRRAEQNNIQYSIVTSLLRAQCSECYCSPHAPGCSKA